MSTTTGRITLVTAPTERPVTATEMMEYARVTELSELDQLNRLADAAVDTVQANIGRQLVTATYDYFLDRFFDPIEIPFPPLQSVTSISYLDTDGVSQTLSTDVYAVDTNYEPGQITRKFNQSWPSIRTIDNAVTIRFVCGYGAATAVPEEAKTMVLMIMNSLYESRLPEMDRATFNAPAYERLKYSLMVKEFV